MALSPHTINKSDSVALASKTSTPRSSVTKGTSFEAVMAQTQDMETAPKRPQVARLPENGRGLPLRATALAGRSPSDMLRTQTFNKARMDLAQTRNMDTLTQNFLGAGGGSTLAIARNMGAANNLRVIAANNNGRGFELSASDFIRTRTVAGTDQTARSGRSRRRRGSKSEMGGIGRLSAKFESGGEGISAIGYDSAGGTSYGKYQIASRVGSMKNFLTFLDSEAPDLAKRLRNAGPANTGSRRGAMPDEWRAIAREQPERFEKLQEHFIHQSHYKPALDAIERSTGIDSSSLSAAMREVIWSTAVQHGPAGAAKIFARADDLSGKASEATYERKMISNVYSLRANQFGSSSRSVREAVQSRFRQEKQIALNMLDGATANRA